MSRFVLATEIGRVPSMTVPLDAAQERWFERLMESLIMIDLHQHPLILAADPAELPEYLASRQWQWGYEAVRYGGWTTVATANILTGLGRTNDLSSVPFYDLVDEIALMLADMSRHPEVVKVGRAEDILTAKAAGKIGFLPTVEHLAIGSELHHVDVLYGLGVRLAGLTYTRKSAIGDGQTERTDCGLSEFGLEVVRRMNELGMVIDLSHAGTRTAHETIERSEAPVVFSHDASASLRPTKRTRRDEDFLACVAKGGLVCVTAVPNSLSDDPNQDINCVLDHYDYLIQLLGPDHVGIGTDTLIGGHEGLHRKLMGRDRPANQEVVYLDGLESPADGKNIIRGLIARGHSDETIRKVAGDNALRLITRVVG
jgi:membrane dipeptidase